jgi:hypothetical protein
VIKTAVLKTRAAKQHPELSALHATWTAEAGGVGWTPDRLGRAVRLGGRRAVTEQDRRVLPIDAAGPSSLARRSGPVPPDPDRTAPDWPAAVLPAPDAVLPADDKLALPDHVAVGGVPAVALQAAGMRRGGVLPG